MKPIKLIGWSVSAKIGWFTGPREPSGCRLWAGAISSRGYATLNRQKVSRLILGLGPGDPRVAMHTCDTPACVEPSHLRAGTQSENMRDASARGRQNNARKTHCKRGHEFTPDAIYVIRYSNGGTARMCRACALENSKHNYRLRREAKLVKAKP